MLSTDNQWVRFTEETNCLENPSQSMSPDEVGFCLVHPSVFLLQEGSLMGLFELERSMRKLPAKSKITMVILSTYFLCITVGLLI